MSTKYSIADTKDWHVREAAHYNGGRVFFAYLYRCVEQPRLSRYVRCDRKTKTCTTTWRVDGADQPSLEAAIEALNTPPVFDDDELAAIARAPTEFTQRSLENFNWEMNDRLVNKGAVEWERGRSCVTDLGRAALAKARGEQS